jgi:hypothetical protein
MPKSPGQSEFVYVSPPRDPDEAERGASPTAVRWVYWTLALLLVVLFVLVAIALHVPTGE